MVRGNEARRRALNRASYRRTQGNLKKQLSKVNQLIACANSEGSTSSSTQHLYEYKRDLMRQMRRQRGSNTQSIAGTAASASSTAVFRRNRVSYPHSFKHKLNYAYFVLSTN